MGNYGEPLKISAFVKVIYLFIFMLCMWRLILLQDLFAGFSMVSLVDF